jgi:hypothetical protein
LSNAPVKDVERRTDAAVMTKVEKRRSRRRPLAVLLCGFILVGGLLYLATTPPPGGSTQAPMGRLTDGLGMDVATGLDPTLSRAASVLAGRAAIVRCWSQRDWQRHTAKLTKEFPGMGTLGPWRSYTSRNLREINVPPAICAELASLVGRQATIRRDASADARAWSLESLAHEAQHVAGILSESQAECYGMQETPRAAGLLGLTQREGRYLARAYWKRWYTRLEPPYSSTDCRNGGALDLHPDSDVWP